MTTPCLIGNVFVDAVTRLTHSAPLSMTSHPIEDGSKVSEYVVDEDETLTMDCTFTDDEQSYFGVETVAIRAANRLTTADDKKAAIVRIKDTKVPVDVTTPKDYFQSFVLLDIQEDITIQTSSCFKATLVFQKARLSALLTDKLPLDKVKKARKVTKKQEPTVDQGAKEPEAVAEGSAEDDKVKGLAGDADSIAGAALGAEY